MQNDYLKILQYVHQIIFNMDESNISECVDLITNVFDTNFPYSTKLILSQILYSSFVSQLKDANIYINFIKTIQEKEIFKMNETFSNFLMQNTQESFFLLEKLIEINSTKIKIDSNKKISYFSNRMLKDEFDQIHSDRFKIQIIKNYEELTKNDFELHKQLIKEGVNPSEIAKIIRNDEIEKLQEISSHPNFDFNQRIEPSLYERYLFINQENVTLIDYAAFFGSIQCFKYLLMNGAKLENTAKYAVAGGNEEIFHLCEQNHSSFENAYETAIKFHQNNIFHYLYENKIKTINNIEDLGTKCILYNNYEILSFLEKEGMKINNFLIMESIKAGNTFIVKYFLEKNPIKINFLDISTFSGNEELINYLINNKYIDFNPKNKDERYLLLNASKKGYIDLIKFLLKQEGVDVNAKDNNGETALNLASENGNIEIVKTLLKKEGIDVNARGLYGWTALMSESYDGNLEIVKLLLKSKGIDINAKESFGETALIKAVRTSQHDIIKLLLGQEEIDINVKNRKGETALMIASEIGDIKMIKLLLEKEGLDINAKNYLGQTALMIATKKNNTEIVNYLKNISK